jgi:hypothetical protein
MATALEHYQEAEDLLRKASTSQGGSYDERYFLDAAQVHATLALAAATALNIGDGGEDYELWRRAASVEAALLNEGDRD